MQSQKPGHGEFFRAKILDKLKKCVKIKIKFILHFDIA